MVTNLIDMFPKRSDLVSLIIDKVCILAQSKIRLIRFGFTFIALSITKVLLNQYENMNNIILRLQSQPTLFYKDENTMAKHCYEMIQENLQLLALEVFQQRAYDPQEFIRKHVLESVSQFDAVEIKAAMDIKDMKLIDILFESLRDESVPIRKLAL